MKKKNERIESAGRLSKITIVLLGILFIAINILSSVWFSSARLDLTEDKLYTLSTSTLKLLKTVDEPIVFRLYVSSELGQYVPHLGIYASRVRDLLLEYQSVSNGKISIELLDPAPFSDVEDQAVASGLKGVPAIAGGDNMYFGLVGSNTTDDVEKIPFLQIDREAFLENDISRKLFALSTSKPTVVGILSTLPTDGTMRITASGQQEPMPPYVVRNQIGELFETKFLGKQVDIVPDDINVLLIVHPKGLTSRTLFAIDQYLLSGGKAMIFVDPFAEVEGMEGQMLGTFIDGSNLESMFKAWGLEYGINSVVGDRLTARKVLPEAGNRTIEYLPWLELRGPSLDNKSPITSGIDAVAVASAGHLKLAPDAPISLYPLLTSSPGSALINVKDVQGFRNPAKLLREFKPGKERYVIAGRITGVVPTAFPSGLPEIRKDDEDQTPPAKTNLWKDEVLKKSVQPLDLIVIADADILADRFWVIMRDFAGQKVPVPTANNGDFILNSIEALAGSSDLMDLRGRGSTARPFGVLQKIQQKAAQQFEDKERELRRTLEKTENELKNLRRRNPEGSAVVISERDRRSMDGMQRKILELRSELRNVRRSLNQEYQALEMKLWFLDIALVPILVTFLAIGLAIWRSFRRKNRAYEARPA